MVINRREKKKDVYLEDIKSVLVFSDPGDMTTWRATLVLPYLSTPVDRPLLDSRLSELSDLLRCRPIFLRFLKKNVTKNFNQRKQLASSRFFIDICMFCFFKIS